MGLIYEENPVRMAGSFNPAKCNANDQWLKHFKNSLYLSFMLKHGNRVERHQASKELVICERKMAYWSRQPHFVQRKSQEDAIRAKKEWSR